MGAVLRPFDDELLFGGVRSGGVGGHESIGAQAGDALVDEGAELGFH